VKLNIDGTLYDYDSEAMTLAEAFELKEKTGLGLAAFYWAWQQGEPAAYAWVAYLTRTRAGETVEDWKTSFTHVEAFVDSIIEAEKAEQESPDPTGPETVSG
jgi:hypothetical protein